jgi:hypothetical protein
MHIRPCKNRQIRVKIGQNGVKIGSKKVKKGAHFVMPILTFWWVTPSGASARAVLACRKGKKARFRGAPDGQPQTRRVTVESDGEFRLIVEWNALRRDFAVQKGKNTFRIE